MFSWDGTTVEHQGAEGPALRARVEALCAAGVHIVVVSGDKLENVDGRLRARPEGPDAVAELLAVAWAGVRRRGG